MSTALRVSSIEAFCGKLRSTRISGRSEDGKNWFCTKRMQNTASTNSSTVPMMVSQRLRMHHSRLCSNALPTRPGSSLCGLTLVLRICTPSTGANRTATTQDTNKAAAITANKV
ncbi:hypothetical protein D3C72_1609990 [compost metagenome]